MIKEFEFKDHEEWLDIRSKYIGGSDAGAVIGLNPYKSRYSLWAEKTGKVPGFEGNISTKVGSYLEELVAKLFEEETGKKVRRKNRTMVNDKYPFACANIDRAIVGEKALLEIKTTTSIPIMKQLRGKEFPEAYYAQVVHYMAVTELEKAYLAVLVNCRELKVYELNRDEAEIDALMQAEEEFWECVKNDTAPALDGMDATSESILAMYPESTDKDVDLMAYESNLRDYVHTSNLIKDLTKMKEEQANIIKEFMRDAGSGSYGIYKVSYKSSERKTFDAVKFAKENKNIPLDDYYKVSSTRTFRVTVKED